MIINHNIAALNTHRQLTSNNVGASKSLEKLSSGLRINRAGDDAAGLAISEKMRGQIRGLEMASKNSQDGISLIQTAEGALNETHSILQRMRELAVQASNDTNTADDRNELQKEIRQLKEEVDRISNTTEFNTKKLLNGNVANTGTVTGTNSANIDSAEVLNSSLASGNYQIIITNTGTAATANGVDAGTGLSTTSVTLGTAADAKYGSYQLKIEDDAENVGKKVITLIDTVSGEEVASQNNVLAGAGGGNHELAGIDIDATAISGNGTFSFTLENDHDIELQDATGNTLSTVSLTGYNKSEIEIGGLKFSFNADLADAAAADTNVTVVNNSLNMQIGANEGQSMGISIGDMSAKALGIDGVDVSSVASAQSAITTVDDALKQVSGERSKLGAYQNRLEHTINNLGTSAENLTAAESRIRDVDMAKEMMNFTKNNILTQASQAMLAQANQQPQGVLQLLR
ncbi:flagellin [Paenibacillus sp. J5C_2022]|uniref:flagellin N-terminal helical domain-containing protein n=1 Tax=Paenibacillus sp. J5C2022 TaxID=2977129 RepID=UPI0021D3A956|nr:flagellin [Paenibacillus sp. J5C2022]MCU6708439.1 flagellin [Paenibacillus sp. J5C2022]